MGLICSIPFQNMIIDADGTVTPCPYILSDPSMDNVLGNVNENSVLEIWNGKPYQKLRQFMLSKKGENGCKDCLNIKQNRVSNIVVPFVGSLKEYAEKEAWKNYTKLLDDIDRKRTKLTCKPSVISYTTSHSCNFRCIMCYQEHVRNIRLDNQADVDKQILELLPHLTQITAGGGEPFMQNIWREMLNEKNENYPLLTFATTTNGTYITQDVIDKLDKYAKTILNFSYDATYKKLFEDIRVFSNFETINANLLKSIKYMNIKGEDKFNVTASMTVMKSNYHNVIDMLNFMIDNDFSINFSGLIAFPLTQSLVSYEHPKKDIISLKKVKKISEDIISFLDNDIFTKNKFAPAKSQLLSLIDVIPFNLTDEKHNLLKTKIPPSYFKAIIENYGDKDFIISFAKIDENANIGKAFWYSSIDSDGNFEAYLPNGKYATYIGERNKGVAPTMEYMIVGVENEKITITLNSDKRKPKIKILPILKKLFIKKGNTDVD